MIVTKNAVRWKQRFENLTRARERLIEAVTANKQEPENHLYQIALVGAFNFTYELSWKTVKDYLEYGGISKSLPRDVIKQAFNSGVITDGTTWITMLEARNLMAHVYDEKNAQEAIDRIHEVFLPALDQVYETLETALHIEPAV